MKFLSSLLILTLVSFSSALAADLVYWETKESMQRIERSKYKTDFFRLTNHFEPQTARTYCGVASAVIVLNTIRGRDSKIKKPSADPGQKKSRLYYGHFTQKNVLEIPGIKPIDVINGKPIKDKNGKMIKDFGLQLRQLEKILKGHGLKTTVRIADKNLKAETIVEEFKKNLVTRGDYILVNYSRPALKQKGGGHISPLAAYDEKSDSFLVLDVNPNNADWAWIKTSDLIRAMRTFDTVENRGYMIIEEGSTN